ncbi:uncharacterized protein M6B38_175775 [Iris pallida]|uniref:Uncharacterized protein n=1 Tax=Iris pallida TaxID=29817 RepID=A0AAX6EQ35_IRIPA|nr:uncharacterized protein M6B38_175775 [Iris pallida]
MVVSAGRHARKRRRGLDDGSPRWRSRRGTSTLVEWHAGGLAPGGRRGRTVAGAEKNGKRRSPRSGFWSSRRDLVVEFGGNSEERGTIIGHRWSAGMVAEAVASARGGLARGGTPEGDSDGYTGAVKTWHFQDALAGSTRIWFVNVILE